ncbi:MAG: succinate dehydrogenase assembly factor 2 [Alphaproteobacteria bacterium]|nr:succinate dehydrogenase assembly factor 2 [Alphaproteobacteria bacterium]
MNGYLQNKIKKLSYQSWHRGTRELDLVLGAFSDKYLSTFSEEELEEYALILKENDLKLWEWISGKIPVYHSEPSILQKICKFYSTKAI